MHAPAKPVSLVVWSESEARRALQAIPTDDLIVEQEAAQWLAADLEGVPGDSFAVARLQWQRITDELTRRQRIATRSAMAPEWPRSRDIFARIDDVKTRWPIDVYCEALLGVRLERHGRTAKACCPLPGHQEKSPSFTVWLEDNHAWCFGCQRGGDVIALTKLMFGFDRITDALRRLEDERVAA